MSLITVEVDPRPFAFPIEVLPTMSIKDVEECIKTEIEHQFVKAARAGRMPVDFTVHIDRSQDIEDT